MLCANCKVELPDDANFCLKCGAPAPKQAGLQVDQKVATVKGAVTGLAAAGTMSAGLDANIEQDIGTVEDGGAVVGAIIGGLGGDVNVGGQHTHGDTVQGDKRVIHTEGGAYIDGNVNTGSGDFVGRDKNVFGDVVQGDKVGSDKITVGGISGSTGIAIGRNAHAEVTTGLSTGELANLFAIVYRQIDKRPEFPDVGKEEIIQTVQNIEKEVAKGDMANPGKVERWLKNLASMAPDILEVTVATLVSPVAGVAAIIRKVVEEQQAAWEKS